MSSGSSLAFQSAQEVVYYGTRRKVLAGSSVLQLPGDETWRRDVWQLSIPPAHLERRNGVPLNGLRASSENYLSCSCHQRLSALDQLKQDCKLTNADMQTRAPNKRLTLSGCDYLSASLLVQTTIMKQRERRQTSRSATMTGR